MFNVSFYLALLILIQHLQTFHFLLLSSHESESFLTTTTSHASIQIKYWLNDKGSHSQLFQSINYHIQSIYGLAWSSFCVQKSLLFDCQNVNVRPNVLGFVVRVNYDLVWKLWHFPLGWNSQQILEKPKPRLFLHLVRWYLSSSFFPLICVETLLSKNETTLK